MKNFKIFTFLLAGILFFQYSNSAEASTLQAGSSGEAVKEVQELLHNLGYHNSNITGYFGPVTDMGVRQLQKDFGLVSDGIVGPVTNQLITDITKLARIVHGEARGESYEGKVAVAAVVFNRVRDDEFPSTIQEVIYQRNAFTAVIDGQYNLTPAPEAFKAVKDAWMGSDPSKGATYYYNPDIATSQWIFTRETILRIGNHLFAK